MHVFWPTRGLPAVHVIGGKDKMGFTGNFTCGAFAGKFTSESHAFLEKAGLQIPV